MDYELMYYFFYAVIFLNHLPTLKHPGFFHDCSTVGDNGNATSIRKSISQNGVSIKPSIRIKKV